MAAAAVRLARRGIGLDYALFALISAGILVVWHFPPTERLLLPLFPFLLAGLISALEDLWRMLKPALGDSDCSQRAAGRVLAAAVAAAVIAAIGLQTYTLFVFLPRMEQHQRVKRNARSAAYQWISANVPAGATMFAYDDVLLYLGTGHRGNSMPLLPRWWYEDNRAAQMNAYRNLADYCHARGLTYAYFSDFDLSCDTADDEREAII
jgi:hypothetical protein